MNEQELLGLPTEELLAKIGAGGHKPGAGSAAALAGLVSCNLASTVVAISLQKKSCESYWPDIEKHGLRLIEIEKSLREGFVEDSVVFNDVFKSRKSKVQEKKKPLNHRNNREITRLSLREREVTKAAIIIPQRIAELSVELVEIASFLFDKGYKIVRGDSEVSLNLAVAALEGCVSLMFFNLHRYRGEKWASNLLIQATELERKLDNALALPVQKRATLRETAIEQNSIFKIDLDELRDKQHVGGSYSRDQIDDIAQALLLDLRTNWESIWHKEKPPTSSLELVNPELAFKAINYKFGEGELGQYEIGGVNIDVGGYIDPAEREVVVAAHLARSVKNFTAAHELGHAVLHNLQVRHRDAPIDGSRGDMLREKQEHEADIFAACFLMPKNSVKYLFEKCFLTNQFEINDDTTFALVGDKMTSLDFRKKCKNLRGLTRELARVSFYNGDPFKYKKSLSERFSVSVEAMAIRFEELRLVKF